MCFSSSPVVDVGTVLQNLLNQLQPLRWISPAAWADDIERCIRCFKCLKCAFSIVSTRKTVIRVFFCGMVCWEAPLNCSEKAIHYVILYGFVAVEQFHDLLLYFTKTTQTPPSRISCCTQTDTLALTPDTHYALQFVLIYMIWKSVTTPAGTWIKRG